MHEMRGRTVDAEHAGAAFALDDVGLEPGAVRHVDDRDLLSGEQVGGVHQVAVDRDGADVVEVGVRDGGAVDLRLQHGAEHGLQPTDASSTPEHGGVMLTGCLGDESGCSRTGILAA